MQKTKSQKVRMLAALSFLLCFGLTQNASAWLRDADPSHVLDAKMDQLKKELALKDSQINQIKPVLQDAISKEKQAFQSAGIQKGMNSSSLDAKQRKQLMNRMSDIQKQTQQKFQQILTPDQMQKWQKMVDAKRQAKRISALW